MILNALRIGRQHGQEQSRFGAVLLASWLMTVSVVAAAESKPPFILKCDHPNATYNPGEPVRWSVEGESLDRFGEAAYVLKKGGLNTILEGNAPLTNLAGKLEMTLSEPGTLLLEIKAKDLAGKPVRVLGGAVVAPGQIQPSLRCPTTSTISGKKSSRSLPESLPNRSWKLPIAAGKV